VLSVTLGTLLSIALTTLKMALRAKYARRPLLTVAVVLGIILLGPACTISRSSEVDSRLTQLQRHGVCSELPLFGVSTHRGRNPDDTNTALVSELGAQVVRIQIPWIEVEWNRKFAFGNFDHLVQGLRKKNRTLILVLAYGHPDHTNGGPEAGFPFAPRTAEQRDAYFNYLQAVVGHFHGPDIVYQIWNEPNIKAFWPLTPADFDVLLKGAATAILKVDPTANILAAGIANERNRDLFVRGMTKAFGTKHVVNFAFHPYRQDAPENSLVDIAAFENASGEAHQQRPVWLTEWGYSETWLSQTYPFNNLRERQAIMTARLMLTAAIAKAKVALLYDLIDDGLNAKNPESKFGLYDYEFRPKKSALAFRKMTELMSTCDTYRFAFDPIRKALTATFASHEHISRVIWTYNNRRGHTLCYKLDQFKSTRLSDLTGHALPIETCSSPSTVKLKLREDFGPLILTTDR